MAKIIKRKIRWSAPTDIDVVGYKVYWVVGGGVINYDNPNVKAFPASVTQVVVPDDLPELESVDDDVTIGVSAYDELGNESDVASITRPFDFAAPGAPTNLEVVAA